MRFVRYILVAAVLAFASNAEAFIQVRHHIREEVTGRIVKTGKSWIKVQDENSVDVFQFFLPDWPARGFEKGERVRVYYYLPGRIVTSIKEMTPLVREDGQNLGCVTGCPVQ